MAQVTELAGHVLGGTYRLVRAVSDGPRKVYEARHARLAGRFAVKQWPATTPWDAFRSGAELAMTLRHPGVLQVIDFNCEPGSSPFLVLEWIEGTRLSEIMADSGILPIERVAPLIESAAWALASAHQQGVVHQELRPDEVFVVHAPGTMREWVKLAGFGVSAALAHAGTAPPSRYRAPEQKARRGDESGHEGDHEGDHQGDQEEGADPQSDQYALAAIAYEMLAGVPPLGDARAPGAEPSRAEPLPISDLAPGVSPAVDAAIRQALATEPEQRFAGVLEFARALRDAVDGASPEALRRRSVASAPERRARVEAVSPFFNPLQGRAGEALRRSTARLRALASRDRLRLPRGPAARIALAGAALLVAVAGAALVTRRHAPVTAETAPVAAAPPARPAAPAAPPAAAPAPAPVPVPAPVAPPPEPASDVTATTAAPPGETTAKQERAAAWAEAHANAHLGARKARAPTSPTVKTKAPSSPAATASAVKHATRVAATAPKPAAPNVAVAAPKPAAPNVAAAAPKPAAPKAVPALAKTPPAPATDTGACMLTVGSRPAADVWLDDHSLGRRTPLIHFRAACGDHKLALKRTDLDLYQMEIVTLRAGAPFKKTYPLQ